MGCEGHSRKAAMWSLWAIAIGLGTIASGATAKSEGSHTSRAPVTTSGANTPSAELSGPLPFQSSLFSALTPFLAALKANDTESLHRKLFSLSAQEIAKLDALIHKEKEQASNASASKTYQALSVHLGFHQKGFAKTIYERAMDLLKKQQAPQSHEVDSPYHRAIAQLDQLSANDRLRQLYFAAWFIPKSLKPQWQKVASDFRKWKAQSEGTALFKLLGSNNDRELNQMLRQLQKTQAKVLADLAQSLSAKAKRDAKEDKLLELIGYHQRLFESNHSDLQRRLEAVRTQKRRAKSELLRFFLALNPSQRLAHLSQLPPTEKKLYEVAADEAKAIQQAGAQKQPKIKNKKFLQILQTLATKKTRKETLDFLSSHLREFNPEEISEFRSAFIQYLYADSKQIKSSPLNQSASVMGYGPIEWFDFVLRNLDTSLAKRIKELALKKRDPQEFEQALFKLSLSDPVLAYDIINYINWVNPSLRAQRPKQFPLSANWPNTLDLLAKKIRYYAHTKPNAPDKITLSDAELWINREVWQPKTLPSGEHNSSLSHIIQFLRAISYDEHKASRAGAYRDGNALFEKLRDLSLSPEMSQARADMQKSLSQFDRWNYEKARARYLQAKLKLLNHLNELVEEPRGWDQLKPNDISIAAWSRWRNRIIQFLKHLAQSDPKHYREKDPLAELQREYDSISLYDLEQNISATALRVHYLALLQSCGWLQKRGSRFRNALQAFYNQDSPYPADSVLTLCSFLAKYRRDLSELTANPDKWQMLRPKKINEVTWRLFGVQSAEFLAKNSFEGIPTVDNENIVSSCQSGYCDDVLSLLTPKLAKKPNSTSSKNYAPWAKKAEPWRERIESQLQIAYENFLKAREKLSHNKELKHRLDQKIRSASTQIVLRRLNELPKSKTVSVEIAPGKVAQKTMTATGRARKQLSKRDPSFYKTFLHDLMEDNRYLSRSELKDPNKIKREISRAEDFGEVLNASQTAYIAKTIGYPTVIANHPAIGTHWQGPISRAKLEWQFNAKELEEVRTWIFDQLEVQKNGDHRKIRLNAKNREKLSDPIDQRRLLNSLASLLSLVNHATIYKSFASKVIGKTGRVSLTRKALRIQAGPQGSPDYSLHMLETEKLAFSSHKNNASFIRQTLLPKVFDNLKEQVTLPGFSWVGLLKLEEIAKEEQKQNPDQLPNIYWHWLIRLSKLMPKSPGGVQELRRLLLSPSPKAIMALAERYDPKLYAYLDEQGKLPTVFSSIATQRPLARKRLIRSLVNAPKEIPFSHIMNPLQSDVPAWQSLKLLLAGDLYQKTIEQYFAVAGRAPASEQKRLFKYLQEHATQTSTLSLLFSMKQSQNPAIKDLLKKYGSPESIMRQRTLQLYVRMQLERRLLQDPNWRKRKDKEKEHTLVQSTQKKLSDPKTPFSFSEQLEKGALETQASIRKLRAERILKEALKGNRKLRTRTSKTLKSLDPKLFEILRTVLLPALESDWQLQARHPKTQNLVPRTKEEKELALTRFIETRRLEMALVEPVTQDVISEWEKSNAQPLLEQLGELAKNPRFLKEITALKEELHGIIRDNARKAAIDMNDVNNRRKQNKKKGINTQQRLNWVYHDFLSLMEQASHDRSLQAPKVQLQKAWDRLQRGARDSIVDDMKRAKARSGYDKEQMAIADGYRRKNKEAERTFGRDLSLAKKLIQIDLNRQWRERLRDFSEKILQKLSQQHQLKLSLGTRKLLNKPYLRDFVASADRDRLNEYTRVAKILFSQGISSDRYLEKLASLTATVKGKKRSLKDLLIEDLAASFGVDTKRAESLVPILLEKLAIGNFMQELSEKHLDRYFEAFEWLADKNISQEKILKAIETNKKLNAVKPNLAHQIIVDVKRIYSVKEPNASKLAASLMKTLAETKDRGLQQGLVTFYQFTPQGRGWALGLFLSTLQKEMEKQYDLRDVTRAARNPDGSHLLWSPKTKLDPLLESVYGDTLKKYTSKDSDPQNKDKHYAEQSLQRFDKLAVASLEKQKQARDRFRQAQKTLGLTGPNLDSDSAFKNAKLHLLYETKNNELTERALNLRKALGTRNIDKIRNFILKKYDNRGQPAHFFELNDHTAVRIVRSAAIEMAFGIEETLLVKPLDQERQRARQAFLKIKDQLTVKMKEKAEDVGHVSNWIRHAFGKPGDTKVEKQYKALDAELRQAIQSLRDRKKLALVDERGEPRRYKNGDRMLVAAALDQSLFSQKQLDRYIAVMPQKWVAEAEASKDMILTLATWYLPGSLFKGAKTAATLYNLHNRTRAMKVLLGAANIANLGAHKVAYTAWRIREALHGGAKMGAFFTALNHSVAAGLFNGYRANEIYNLWRPGGNRVDAECKIRKEYQSQVPQYLDWNHDGILDHCQGGKRWKWVLPSLDQMWPQMKSSAVTFGLGQRLAPYMVFASPRWQMAVATGFTGAGTTLVSELSDAWLNPSDKKGDGRLSRWEALWAKATDPKTYFKAIGEGSKSFALASPIDDYFAMIGQPGLGKLLAIEFNQEVSGVYASLQHTALDPVRKDKNGNTIGGYHSLINNRRARDGWEAYWFGRMDSIGGDTRAGLMSLKSRLQSKVHRDIAAGKSIEAIQERHSEEANKVQAPHIVDEVLSYLRLKELHYDLNGDRKVLSNADEILETLATRRGLTDPDDLKRLKEHVEEQIFQNKGGRRKVVNIIDQFIKNETQTALAKFKAAPGKAGKKLTSRVAAQPELAETLSLKHLSERPDKTPSNNTRKILYAVAQKYGFDPELPYFKEYLHREFHHYKEKTKNKRTVPTLKQFFAHLNSKYLHDKAIFRGSRLWQLKNLSAAQKAFLAQAAKNAGINVQNLDLLRHFFESFQQDTKAAQKKFGVGRLTPYRWVFDYRRRALRGVESGLAQRSISDLDLKSQFGGPTTLAQLYYLAHANDIPVNRPPVWKKLKQVLQQGQKQPHRKRQTLENFLKEFEKDNWKYWSES